MECETPNFSQNFNQKTTTYNEISNVIGKSTFYIKFKNEDLVDLVENIRLSKDYLQATYKLKTRFFCNLCNSLMDEPVQTNCGCRFCDKCCDNYFQLRSTKCPSKDCQDIEITRKIPDRAIKKEMSKISISCINDNCEMEIFLTNLRFHFQQCPESVINCKKCFAKILSKNQLEHEKVDCINRSITCQMCWKTMPAYEYENIHLNTGNLFELCEKFTSICPYKCSDEKYSNIKRHLIEKHSKYENSLKNCSLEIIEKIERYYQKIKKIEMSNNELYRNADSVDLLKEELTNVKDLLGRISCFNHIGSTFVWEIKHFSDKVRKSKSRENPSILSQPFYTKEIGYKMFLKIYPYGDGIGRGTHLSIYMAIGKGKYDSLLTWPFSQKFKIHILNQNSHKDVTECFRPNPESISYQRPDTEINIATGNPCFLDFKTLHQNDDFLKDDLLFIKFVVLG